MSDREVARQKNQTNLILFKERDDSFKNRKSCGIFRPTKKVRAFHVPNLIPIQVDPNDISSSVDSDVELKKFQTQLIFTMYNGLKYLPVKRHYSSLCIRFGTRKVQCFRNKVAPQSKFLSGPLELNSWVNANQMDSIL